MTSKVQLKWQNKMAEFCYFF